MRLLSLFCCCPSHVITTVTVNVIASVAIYARKCANISVNAAAIVVNVDFDFALVFVATFFPSLTLLMLLVMLLP